MKSLRKTLGTIRNNYSKYSFFCKGFLDSKNSESDFVRNCMQTFKCGKMVVNSPLRIQWIAISFPKSILHVFNDNFKKDNQRTIKGICLVVPTFKLHAYEGEKAV